MPLRRFRGQRSLDVEFQRLFARARGAGEAHLPIGADQYIGIDALNAIFHAVAQVGNARISGTPITGEVAKIILSSPRQKGAGKRMDGIYEVIEIDNENPDGYTGRVKNTSTNEEFTVSISKTELTDDDIDALFKALRDRTTVNALINAWLVGDRITHASVMRANVPL